MWMWLCEEGVYGFPRKLSPRVLPCTFCGPGAFTVRIAMRIAVRRCLALEAATGYFVIILTYMFSLVFCPPPKEEIRQKTMASHCRLDNWGRAGQKGRQRGAAVPPCAGLDHLLAVH